MQNPSSHDENDNSIMAGSELENVKKSPGTTLVTDINQVDNNMIQDPEICLEELENKTKQIEILTQECQKLKIDLSNSIYRSKELEKQLHNMSMSYIRWKDDNEETLKKAIEQTRNEKDFEYDAKLKEQKTLLEKEYLEVLQKIQGDLDFSERENQIQRGKLQECHEIIQKHMETIEELKKNLEENLRIQNVEKSKEEVTSDDQISSKSLTATSDQNQLNLQQEERIKSLEKIIQDFTIEKMQNFLSNELNNNNNNNNNNGKQDIGVLSNQNHGKGKQQRHQLPIDSSFVIDRSTTKNSSQLNKSYNNKNFNENKKQQTSPPSLTIYNDMKKLLTQSLSNGAILTRDRMKSMLQKYRYELLGVTSGTLAMMTYQYFMTKNKNYDSEETLSAIRDRIRSKM